MQVEKAARDNLLNSADFYGSEFQAPFLARLADSTSSLGTRDGHSDENLSMHKNKILEDVDSGQQPHIYDA